MTTHEIYWLAGILEGEGCFTMQPTSPRIQLKMCDEDIIIKARSLMQEDSRIFIIPAEGNRKTSYRISIHGIRAIEWMMTLYPLMGRRRKEKIREVVKIWKEVAPRTATKSVKSESVLIRRLAKFKNISYDEAKRIFEATIGVM